MTSRRRGLGRGLDALIPNSQPAVQEVDIDLIAPNPNQPRNFFEPEALAELTESIREHGVIQPLIVSRPEGKSDAPYQLIAGERRLLASREAGLKRVSVIVREASPQSQLELALVENLQREDLGPLEEAAAFRRLSEEFNLTQEAIAARVGRSRPAIANSLRLLSLPAEIQASLANGEISAGHARAILSIEDQRQQVAIWRKIVGGQLTVRAAEALVKESTNQKRETAKPNGRSADLAALEEQLRSSLGTKVDLTKGRKGGRIVIHFFSDEELGSIVEKLG